jgi:hypothetical protein
LNAVLLGAAQQRGQIDLELVRVETTGVEAGINYPTDSGLLTAAIGRIASRPACLARPGQSQVREPHRHRAGVAALDRGVVAAPQRRRTRARRNIEPGPLNFSAHG